MIIGVTFTYMSLLAKEEDDSTVIKTGILSVKYIDGPDINAFSLVPMKEANLDTKDFVYKKKFSVYSDGTLEQNFDIFVDVNKNEFEDNFLIYSLYNKNGQKISSGYLPKSGTLQILSNEYLNVEETKDYTLLIWLKENNQDQNSEQLKKFKAALIINSTQLKYD